MEHIDDYDMLEKDTERSLQYAKECYAVESIATDERRGWDERIRATAEIMQREKESKEKTHSI